MTDEAILRQRVGHRIKVAREDAGLTQEQVAHQVGMARSSIANLEAGRQDMNISRLALVAAAVNLNLADLIRPEDLPGLRPLPAAPHKVTIRRVHEVTCETCTPGQPFDIIKDYAEAVAAMRTHIAEMRGAS